MLGPGDGGAFVGGAGFPEHVIEGEAVFRQAGGGQIDANLVSAEQRTEVAGLAFGDGNDDPVVGEKRGERDPGGGQGLFVGFVANGKVTGEEHYTGGVGVGKMNGAGVRKSHAAEMVCPMTNVQ